VKIRPVGADFFHANRRTDRIKLTVVFCDFENEPKNYSKKYFFISHSVNREQRQW
jgi:hypothetical protein